ncbi:MAG: flap endonuclease-1 [Nanoarchaeota archaeon]
MGSPITDLLTAQEVRLADLKGKTLAVDTFNQLYMFLATIRQPDGTPLKDSHGNVTSHLSGLFSRFTKLMIEGVRFVFIFDGIAPDLKRTEQRRRSKAKEDAMLKLEEATQKEDVESMRKYAARTSRLDPSMIADAKRLITCLGMSIIEAPSEGEAQASQLVKEGTCYAVMSQDADSLLFGSPRLIKNLTISQRRRQTGTAAYSQIRPALIDLSANLQTLGISQEQLITLGMLVGTDYNWGGIKGIGPKKALKLIKDSKNIEEAFEAAAWTQHCDVDWKDIMNLFTHMPVQSDIKPSFGKIDIEGVLDLMVRDHDFDVERIRNTMSKLTEDKTRNQTSLDGFMR